MDERSRLYGAVELAKELGMTPRALRFYESKGLIAPRRAGARRVYDYRDRGRLNLILRGKRLGFSLAEIRDYLELYDSDPTHIGQLQHLEETISGRIHDLEQQQVALEHTLAELKEIRTQTRRALSTQDPKPCGANNTASSQPPLLNIGDDA